MRILFISYFYEYNYGGAEVVARTLRRELVKQGHTVDVLCLAGGPATQPEKIWRMPVPAYCLRNPQAAKRIIIFLNNGWFDRMAEKAARGLSLPMDSYDLIHCQDAFSLVVGARLAEQHKKPLGLTMHDNYPRPIMDDLGSRLTTPIIKMSVMRRDRNIQRYVRQCAWVAAVSKHVRDRAIAYLGADRPGIYAIYNSYPAAPDVNPQGAPAQSPPRLLFIGRLSREKGIDLLIEALGRYTKPIQLTVLGIDGPLRGEVERAAQRDSRIKIQPPVPHDQVPRFLREHDLICCPSNWDEPFGLTVLEARAHQRPILASDFGGIPEILEGYPRRVVLNAKGRERNKLVQDIADGIDKGLALTTAPLDIEREREFLERFNVEKFTRHYLDLYKTGSTTEP